MVVYYSFDIVAEQVPFLCVAIIAITKYLNYVLHTQRVRKYNTLITIDLNVTV